MLVGLYLRGSPALTPPPRRRWPDVVRVLRQADPPLEDASQALYAGRLWVEAAMLAAPGLVTWAVAQADRAITPLLDEYPARWIERLGPAAPPALWARRSANFAEVRPLLGVVGSRRIDPEVGAFAEALGSQIVRQGFDLVSGGATGCDRRAWQGARREGRPGVCLSPSGLPFVGPTGGLDLALAPPWEPFSTGAAMERNPLIFAAAEATVVVHARLRAGGSWQGATEALRRRLGPVIVREDPASAAHRALIALGARPIRRPEELPEVLGEIRAQGSTTGPQGSLFAYG